MSLNSASLKSFSKTYATASLIVLAALLTACGGGGGGSSTPPPPGSYTIGGSISGLTGSGLTLQDNGGNNLQVAAGATSFVFSTAVTAGGAYAVTVLTQPSSPPQTCTVTGGSGTVASSDVTNISIKCVTGTVTVGGTISGLTGSGLMLQDNGGDTLAVAAGATTFTFATPVTIGAAYAVTVSAQPSSPAQTCTVTAGSGTAPSSNVTNVSITCVTGAVTVGGTISGLTASGLVLQDNGGDNLTVAANATTFTFATPVLTGMPYSVAVLTQPTGETCTVSGGSGMAGATAVTTVSIVCSAVTVTVGGTITGLAGTGLVLQDNGGDNLTVPANATSFTFATKISEGSMFNVTVLTQPSGPLETCTVTGATGTAGATNITSVAVSCAPAKFTIGGTITGVLAGTGLVLQDNAGDNLTVAANATTFTFATALPVGSNYAVTVATQPTSPAAVCTVANGSGTVVASNVTSVTVNCVGVGRYVYVVNSIDNGNPGDVAAFSINQSTGALTAIAGGNVTADTAPTGIAIDTAGQYAYVSNKNSTDVSLFTIGANGALTPGTPTQNFKSSGVGEASIAIAPSNQYVFIGGYEGTNPTNGAAWGASIGSMGVPTFVSGGAATAPNDPLTSIAVDPTSSFVFGTTSASTHVYAFSIGTGVNAGVLTIAGNSPIGNNAHGAGVAVWPLGNASGGYIYVADNLSYKVSGFAYDSMGNLTAISGTPLNTNGANPTGIAVDPVGQVLYVTNYGDNSISSFSINAPDGTLTPISRNLIPTGNGPTDIKIDPSNKFAYVVNTLDGTISTYTVGTGANAGILSLVGSALATGTNAQPVALAIE